MRSFTVLLSIISLFFFGGCATVFNGYYADVELKDAPDNLKVFTADGVEIPVQKYNAMVGKLVPRDSAANPNSIQYYEYKNVLQPAYRIKVRSNLDPVLVLKFGEQVKKVQVFGSIGAGWFILDAVFGLPMFVDALTGNWNSYEAIDASFK